MRKIAFGEARTKSSDEQLMIRSRVCPDWWVGPEACFERLNVSSKSINLVVSLLRMSSKWSLKSPEITKITSAHITTFSKNWENSLKQTEAETGCNAIMLTTQFTVSSDCVLAFKIDGDFRKHISYCWIRFLYWIVFCSLFSFFLSSWLLTALIFGVIGRFRSKLSDLSCPITNTCKRKGQLGQFIELSLKLSTSSHHKISQWYWQVFTGLPYMAIQSKNALDFSVFFSCVGKRKSCAIGSFLSLPW